MSPGDSAMLLFLIFISALTTDVSALSCDWSAGSGKLAGYIPGNPSTVFVTNGAGECRDQCMGPTGFICAAVNYRESDGLCELLTENNQTASVVEPFDGSWLYFIRPLCAGIWLPWQAVRGSYIKDNGVSPSNVTNLQECMTSCMRYVNDNNDCRAINSATSSNDGKNCRPRSKKVGDSGTVTNKGLNWQYFNRPAWYLDSSNTSTPVDIRDQGTIGSYLHIFTALTIPASGYLVAWQYYMKTVNSCLTYASIWRPNSDASIYTLISNTLLAPEEPSTEGVRFQYIQNEIIRVQQNDVLSVYSDRTGPACEKPIVSVNENAGSETTITITNGGKLDINTTRSRTTNSGLTTTPRSATPALKAYVSAYLSLDGAPQTYHNTSLSSGQIWLKLPPLTTEESVVVAGYKVLCSTVVNLSPHVPCYDSLVPVNSRDVLLNLPDVIRTYHVSVQVARNFNGTELLDDKYSPVSSAFCTARYLTDPVTISESNITSAADKPNITVTSQHVFLADDMCAKDIKLNYSDYDSEYMTIDKNLQIEYILQLEQGTTYELTIYLKLADDAEIMFWTQEYTTFSVATTTLTTTIITSPTSETMNTTTALMDDTPAPTKSNSKSPTDSIIPIVVGVAVPLVLITLIVTLVILYRRGAFDRFQQKPHVTEFTESVEMDKLDTSSAPNIQLSTIPLSTEVETKPVVKSKSNSKTKPSKPENDPKPRPAPKPKSKASLKPPVSTKPEPQQQDTDPTYENSTRILVQNLYQRIQEEKMRRPEHPFKEEFHELSHPNLPHDEGRTAESGKKNRFKNITAFNDTRVKLEITDSHTCNYINASYIKDYEGRVRYIAAQGPTQATTVDMWRMIHTTKAKVVVMVTNAVECGKKKCAPYWPETDTARFGEFSVTLTDEKKFAFYIIRKMRYSVDGERGTVTQCQYTEWYDQDIPSTAGLLSFRARVKQETGTSQSPVIVHCSAGVGRTGTYIALENLIQEAFDKHMKQKSVDVFGCVNMLRAQRMLMVQVPEQYAFLYDMVSEALSCGETSVLSSEFPQALYRWRQQKGSGGSVLSEQFAKLNLTSRNFPDEMYCIAASEENVYKNRDPNALPLNNLRVLINHPERGFNDYINATFCNGYQQKDGFIVAQIPLSTTTADYWRMIMEQNCTFVVYFNDCLEEIPHVPFGGQSVKAGQILVTGITTDAWDDGAGHFKGAAEATESVVECKYRARIQRVTILEIKMRGTKLPTSKQLVSLCQKSERYTTSGTDVIAVQCRNGCRLSGLFVIAMNLYIRTRIEHEVDIVLEVKLARLSRAQFISKLEEFEALYDFVEYYLSQFNEYSNFTDLRKTQN